MTAPHLKLVVSSIPEKPPRFEVRITVNDQRQPVGRTRSFRLRPNDLEELINVASD